MFSEGGLGETLLQKGFPQESSLLFSSLRFSSLPFRLGLPLQFFDLCFQSRDHLVQVGHDTVLSDSEDRSACIFVYSYDQWGAFDSAHMLERTADAERKIHLWFDFAPGSTYLMILGQQVLVHNGPGTCEHAAQSIRQRLEHIHVGLIPNAAAY